MQVDMISVPSLVSMRLKGESRKQRENEQNQAPTAGSNLDQAQTKNSLNNIAEIIIDEVSFSDSQHFRDLKSCALTCRNFLNASQRYIFRSITWSTFGIFGPNQLDKFLRLQNILSTSPYIASYVHAINLFHRGVGSAFVHQPSLPNILSMLKNVTAFRFELFPRYDWNKMTSQFQQILATVLSSSTLETLHLSGISNLPLVSVRWMKCITDVSLSSITFGQSTGEDAHRLEQFTGLSQGRYLKRLSLESDICYPNDGILRPHIFQPLIDCISPPHCMLEMFTVDSTFDLPAATEIIKNTRVLCSR
ncbi:hypothetical protein BDQ17DRAFT_901822 [Cyathus striatus]|nr:hypothetical protein BDQ17DRAFT_901822 [Cyathus striatus]